MKSYKHTNIISLRKHERKIISLLDGSVHNAEHVRWYWDPSTLQNVAVLNGRVYTKDTYNMSFSEFISRQNELVELTVKESNRRENEVRDIISFDIVASPASVGMLVEKLS